MENKSGRENWAYWTPPTVLFLVGVAACEERWCALLSWAWIRPRAVFYGMITLLDLDAPSIPSGHHI